MSTLHFIYWYNLNTIKNFIQLYYNTSVIYCIPLMDEYISNLFYTNKNKLNCNYFRPKWIESHSHLFLYLQHRFKDSLSIYETLYRIKYKLEKRPCCIICGGKVKFSKGYGFANHCSAKCSANDINTRKAHDNTCFKHYGVYSYTKTKDYIKKSRETYLAKYGVEHSSKADIVKQHSRETCLEKYGKNYVFETDEFKEKSKKTCLKKYGHEYVTQSNIHKEKIKNTCNEKYGVNSYLETNNCRIKSLHTKYGESKLEKKIYLYLKNYFSTEDILRQYKSNDYPYHCDFYIKTKDLYIEINGSWVHNSHAYDKNNDIDAQLKNEWENKAKTSTYYKRALDIWTKSDCEKRELAKNKNLNFIEAWSFDEFKDKLLSYIK